MVHAIVEFIYNPVNLLPGNEILPSISDRNLSSLDQDDTKTQNTQ